MFILYAKLISIYSDDYEYSLRILQFAPPSKENETSGVLRVLKSIRVNTPTWVEALNGQRLAIRIGVDHDIGLLKVIDWQSCSSEICTSDESHSSTLELCASQRGIVSLTHPIIIMHY